MIKPIGNRLLIRIEERKQLIKLMNDDKKSNWRFFIEDIGDGVSEEVEIDMNGHKTKGLYTPFEIDQEIILYEHTHFQGWPDCEKENGKNLRIISVADVWGVVKNN